MYDIREMPSTWQVCTTNKVPIYILLTPSMTVEPNIAPELKVLMATPFFSRVALPTLMTNISVPDCPSRTMICPGK